MALERTTPFQFVRWEILQPSCVYLGEDAGSSEWSDIAGFVMTVDDPADQKDENLEKDASCSNENAEARCSIGRELKR